MFCLLYEELHAIADKQMSSQRADHTLQPTALVNEAWIKIAGNGAKGWNDRAHFLGVAALAMRQVLIDHARRKASAKRNGQQVDVELDDFVVSMDERSGGVLRLDEALQRLQQRDPEAVRLVELHFFGGCTLAETASILGISERQAARSWAATRLILAQEMERG